MIAIAKYVELCKYTVAYVGLNFLQRSSAVAEGLSWKESAPTNHFWRGQSVG